MYNWSANNWRTVKCPVPDKVRQGYLSACCAMQGYSVVLFIVALAKAPDRQGQAEIPGGCVLRQRFVVIVCLICSSVQLPRW
jgi:hypothetical protein